MVERINMSKGVNLGWGTTMDMQLVGRAWGMDIYTDQSESSYQTIWVYDRNRTQPARRSDWYNATEGVQHRIVARVELSLERGAWAVDLLQVDSRYKGKNLAIRLYRFLLRRLDITLRAGDRQCGIDWPEQVGLLCGPDVLTGARLLTSPSPAQVS